MTPTAHPTVPCNSFRDFACAVDFRPADLRELIRKLHQHYYVRQEYDGRKLREFSVPSPVLMGLLRRINSRFLAEVELPNCVHSRRGRSTYSCALQHVAQSWLVRLGIAEFFPSITTEQVYGTWRGLGAGDEVSRLLSRLCTLNGALPLGAPTSSSIGNIVLFRADERIQAACNVAGVTFTRWVDDLYLSGNAAPKLIGFAIRAVHDAGFRINRKKISVHGPGRRHVVAGWVVNGLLPTAPREMVSRVMADMKRIELTPGSERHKLIRSIEGSMSYLATSNSRSVKTIAARLQRLS